ncbi:MAG: cation:proton antiporter [Candidatus Nezhaarchaeota archaeon]|nr:cation:proton antiporter [Candidatus Nezhaarchaeota archaeon]
MVIEVEHVIVISVLASGVLFAWLFRRLGLVDVVGYVAGGLVLGFLLDLLGTDLEPKGLFIEPLIWLGLVLFSFRIGTSIELGGVFLSRVLALELVVYLVQWVAASFIASALSLDLSTRIALFFVLVNSSSIAVVFLGRTSAKMGVATKEFAYFQTHVEDLAQFILFTLLITGGMAILQPAGLAFHLVKVGGLVVIMLYLSKFVLRALSRSPLMVVRENKFFTSIVMALLFASVATLLGLPPLIGAFIAGASFALYSSVGDIGEKLDGLRDLGLLIYFTFLGLQFYLGLRHIGEAHVVIFAGVVIGLLAFISRAVGVFVGSLLSGLSVRNGVALALALTPLSEVGIVFLDALTEHGVVSEVSMYTLCTAVITSLAIFSVAVPRLEPRAAKIEGLFPRGFTQFMSTASREYVRRLAAVSSALAKVSVFAAAVLTISYANTAVVGLAKMLHLPALVAAFSTVASSAAVLAVFLLSLKRIVSPIVASFMLTPGRAEPLEKLFDTVVGGLAVVLQIQLLHEYVELAPLEPLHFIVVLAVAAIIGTTVYEVTKYLRQPALTHK